MIKPEYKQKPIRSYVIRAGRITESQKRAFDRWWDIYGMSLHDGLISPAAIFSRTGPLVVEIGFGMGGSLLQMAQAATDVDFLGIEVHPPGVGRLISCAGDNGVKNLRVYMADALDVINDCLPDESVDRIQVFFPDPWHKKKHNKRRIIQPAFVAELWHKLKPGGTLHLATDWEDYAEYMMEVMCSAPGYRNNAPQYHFAPRPKYRPTTKFEMRGERLGHGVWDIVFEKIQQ